MSMAPSTPTAAYADEGPQSRGPLVLVDSRTSTTSAGPGDRRKVPHRRHRVRAAFGLLGVGVLILVTLSRRHELLGSIASLVHLQWVWGIPAVALEWLSFSAFSRMQRVLLRSGGADVPERSMLAIVFAANAIATSTPLVGPELGAAYTFRRFKQRGVDSPSAGWVLLIGGVASWVGGIVVLALGALLSGNDVLGLFGAVTAAAGFGLVILGHRLARSVRLRWSIESVATRLIQSILWLARRPIHDPTATTRRWVDRLALIRPSGWVWAGVGGLTVANWLSDAGVLAASIYAVGGGVPWHALLLIYGSAVIIRSLGVTPGGLGLVEATLCVGLVATGVHVKTALAAVLLYRFISFWIPDAVGGSILLWSHRHRGACAHSRAIPRPQLSANWPPGLFEASSDAHSEEHATTARSR